jgi:polysaccharide biosynthesis transport protein
MELIDVGRILWKRRWTVLLVLIATVGIGAAFAFTTPKEYESTATLAFTPDGSKGPAEAIPPAAVASLLGTYAVTAKSDVIIRQAETEQGHKLTGTLTTSPRLETGILQISDRASAPRSAALAVAAVSAAFIKSLKGNGLVQAQVVDPPTVDATPVQPRPSLIIGVALFLGLAAGCMLALALNHFRQRVGTADEVAEVVDVPVLGHVPYKRSMARRGATSIVWESPQLADIQESMRALRTNLQLIGADAPRSILVTSATAAEGKTTLVANLGIALSQAGIATIILDADMRNPRQHDIFGLDNSDGLSLALQGRDTNERTPTVQPQQTRYDHLRALTAGPPLAMSTELLYTRFRSMLAELLTLGSLVLIDSPPLLPVADARIIASEVEATIMVVNAVSERPAMLRSAVEKLRLADARVTGIVLNQTADAGARDYHTHDDGVRG